MVECRWNFPGAREIYSRDPEEIRDDGLQGHDQTYGIEPKILIDALSEMVDAMMYH